MRIQQRAAVLLLLATIVGCGGQSGPQRVVLTGKITYQGKPIEKGQIIFCPTEGSVNPRSGADIVDGKYTVTACGGVPVGTHRVEITALRMLPLPSGKTVADYGDLGPPMKQYLPAKYNRQSELKVEVTPTGPKDLSFDLKG